MPPYYKCYTTFATKSTFFIGLLQLGLQQKTDGKQRGVNQATFLHGEIFSQINLSCLGGLQDFLLVSLSDNLSG